jgi:hypothetical protein
MGFIGGTMAAMGGRARAGCFEGSRGLFKAIEARTADASSLMGPDGLNGVSSRWMVISS